MYKGKQVCLKKRKIFHVSQKACRQFKRDKERH